MGMSFSYVSPIVFPSSIATEVDMEGLKRRGFLQQGQGSGQP